MITHRRSDREIMLAAWRALPRSLSMLLQRGMQARPSLLDRNGRSVGGFRSIPSRAIEGLRLDLSPNRKGNERLREPLLSFEIAGHLIGKLRARLEEPGTAERI